MYLYAYVCSIYILESVVTVVTNVLPKLVNPGLIRRYIVLIFNDYVTSCASRDSILLESI